MRMKDYYAILECTPLSTINDIKKKYRKLAKQYHPDKQPNDPYAAAFFHDLKEAYETLTQPERKEAWLNKRWLHQVQNTFQAESTPLTPDRILKKLLKLDRELSLIDVYRMDQYTTIKELEDILNEENLNCLKQFNEQDINHTILLHMLACTKPFRYPYLKNVWKKLYVLAENNIDQTHLIDQIKNDKKRSYQLEKYTMPMVILITLLLCVMIKKIS